MLTLYFAQGTCALASLIALEEAGLAYEPKKLSIKDNEQRAADYLAINPKGRVPAWQPLRRHAIHLPKTGRRSC